MIRPFMLSDLSSILQIERQSFPKSPYDWVTFVNLYYQHPRTFLVFIDRLEERQDPQILGYIVFAPDGHLVSIAVHPQHRRKGIGKKLLERVFHTTPQIKKVWAEVRKSNGAAQAFYLKAGFRVVGEVPNYYGNEDALIVFWTSSSNPPLTR